ncbi:M20/M25/M40 family metallo-hydrolase [Fontimonas sp. SYSU GA230001]|uniref:M20/M25/M40 family metallo-hydrolase n=1 Tax=Fontimonas sp. SYSU GA230001 TaxID=3142450 RepID=UPI0032B5B2D5
MKRATLVLAVAALSCAALLAGRAGRLQPAPKLAAPVARVALDDTALAARLADALRLPTVSYAEAERIDPEPFRRFHALLRAQFPQLHRTLDVEAIGAFGLLYRWAGSDRTCRPALLAAHMDVVPVEPGTERRWTHPPFAGAIADGYVWGRGALDDKSNLIAQLEAVEWLLTQGFRPACTVYFAYGHDEEVGGADGAARIAATLRARGARLAWTLDEGSAITRGIIAGVDAPVAAIMAGEKGYATFRLTAQGSGGHASTPGPDNAILRLARALSRLAERPMPARLLPPVAGMLDRLAPHMPVAERVLIANRDLFEPLLLRALSATPITDALIRSTQAVTVVRAGVKDNVLPSEAQALVNVRLLPGDRIADAREHLRRAIDDPAIAVEIAAGTGFANEAPPLSDPQSPEFTLIERTVNEIFPQALVTSGIILATTDNRHYADLRDQAWYFSPYPYTPDDQPRVHGTDERIGIEAYADMVRFYIRLLQNTGA